MPDFNKKKILLVTRPIAPPWDEASKNFAYFLAKNLAMFEVHLLTKNILPNLGENIIQHPIYTSSQNDFTFSQKIRSLFFQWKNKDAFDIAHYFFTPTKFNSFFIKTFLKSKKARAIQTIATLREDLYSEKELKKMMFGDLIITYSDYAKDKLVSFGFDNIKRVYPGIDLDEYKKTEKNQTLLEKYGFKNSDFIINFTGEYTRLEAIDNIIESFIQIASKIENIKLSLALRVKNEKDAQKKIKVVEKLKQANLLEKVSFHDDGTERMNEIYSLADISLFPVQNMRGKFDIPLAVVEAMACEKPVILSDLLILSELNNGQNSVIIKKDNQAQLIAAILDLYNNPEKRSLIGKNARKFVEERFDIQNIAREYEQLYKKL